jgi:hypothetical protein
LDGEQSGAGKKADFFDFSLLTTLELPDPNHTLNYQKWAKSWPSEFRKLVSKKEQTSRNDSPELVYASN